MCLLPEGCRFCLSSKILRRLCFSHSAQRGGSFFECQQDCTSEKTSPWKGGHVQLEYQLEGKASRGWPFSRLSFAILISLEWSVGGKPRVLTLDMVHSSSFCVQSFLASVLFRPRSVLLLLLFRLPFLLFVQRAFSSCPLSSCVCTYWQTACTAVRKRRKSSHVAYTA